MRRHQPLALGVCGQCFKGFVHLVSDFCASRAAYDAFLPGAGTLSLIIVTTWKLVLYQVPALAKHSIQ